METEAGYGVHDVVAAPLVSELRIAGAKNSIIAEIDADFGFKNLLDLDLSDDLKSLALEHLSRAPQSLIEVDRQRDGTLAKNVSLLLQKFLAIDLTSRVALFESPKARRSSL